MRCIRLVTGRGQPAARPDADVLVLADAMSVVWAPRVTEEGSRRPWEQHAAFLCGLLGAPPPGEPAATPAISGHLLPDPGVREVEDVLETSRGPAADTARQILQTFEEDFPDYVESRPRAGATAAPAGPWLTAAPGGRALGRIRDGLESCCRLCDLGDPDLGELNTAVLNLYACRIYLPQAQVSRLTDTECPPLPHACVDLRFHGGLRRFWMIATLSLWSGPPASLAHAPGGRDSRRWSGPGDVQAAMQEVRDAFNEKLKTSFSPLRLTVFGRPYRPPRFWISRGEQLLHADPDLRGAALDRASRRTLGSSAAGSTVAEGFIETDGGRTRLHVLRRFVPDPGAPSYLVVPELPAGWADREDAVRDFIYGMTAVEVDASAKLYDTSTDADIYMTLGACYGYVAEQGNVLWDDLAMRFPIARGRRLDEVHELAQFMHQILLQGVGDLENLHSLAGDLATDLAKTITELAEEFDNAFTEIPTDGRTSIRDSFIGSGYIQITNRSIAEANATVQRAHELFQGILNSVSQAFDERRVRLTDRVAVWALALAVLLAGLPFLSEVWGRELGHWSTPDVHVTLWSGSSAVLVAVVFLVWFRRRRIGNLRVSEMFRARHAALSDYLSRCRTERLEEIWLSTQRAARDTGVRRLSAARDDWSSREIWSSYHQRWDREDDELSRQCAQQLQAMAQWAAYSRRAHGREGTGTGRKSGRGERAARSTRMELWALASLFATQRPLYFYGYPLPRLMLLYAAHPVWDVVNSELGPYGPSLVADSDLTLTLRIHCRAQSVEIPDVRRWLEALQAEARGWAAATRYGAVTSSAWPARVDACAVRQAILRTGIRVGMTRKDWETTLGLMKGSLQADSIVLFLAANGGEPRGDVH